jgi:hypothetical protein
MKPLTLKITTLILATLLTLPKVWAAEVAKTEETKSVEASVNELLLIRDDANLSETEKLARELDLRKKILKEVLTLSLEEVNRLADKLDNLPQLTQNSREKALQNDYRASLTNHLNYYTTQLAELDKLTTLEEVKNLAQKVKEYRDNAYNPEVQKIVNFVLVFYNEEVLKLAKTRLEKITTDIKKLEKLGYIKEGAFSREIKLAGEKLSSAQTALDQAKTTILSPAPTSETAGESKTEEGQAVIEPGKLIEDSLNKVKSAYDLFLEISKNLRKTLGIK